MTIVTGGVVLLLSVGFSTILARVAIGRVFWAAGIDRPRPRPVPTAESPSTTLNPEL